MTAPRTYFHPGRASKAKPRAIEVESQPCAAALNAECHELVNDARGRTACLFCGLSWASLDALIRGAA